MKSTLPAAFYIINVATALNILVLHCQNSRSHLEFTNVLTTALLEKGHHVHELVGAPTPTHPNRTTFAIEENMHYSFLDLKELTTRTDWFISYRQAKYSVENCERALTSQASRDLLALARDPTRRPRIDVVVMDFLFGQCLGAFAREFGDTPIVAVTAFGNPIDVDELLGAPTFPSFVPHDVAKYSRHDTMTWTERLHNKMIYLMHSFFRETVAEATMDDMVRKFFGDQAANMEEVKRNVQVALVNSHPALQGARPQLPAVVEIGGIHVPPLKDIPEGELKQFLDSATGGFIYMSLGSFLRTDAMEMWRRKDLFRVFERLKPLRVVMKWDEPWTREKDGPLPSNVLLNPWLPQSDILGHPNIRLFVTHCGVLSTFEIVHRGVPIVGIPFMVDQFINAKSLAAVNVAKILPYDQLREEPFYNAIRSVLDDDSYAKAVRRLSSIVRDQVETPKERAVFWVEFVARHGGAPHLRSPAERLTWTWIRNWWLLDDIPILFVAVFSIASVLRCLIKVCVLIRMGKTEKLKEE